MARAGVGIGVGFLAAIPELIVASLSGLVVLCLRIVRSNDVILTFAAVPANLMTWFAVRRVAWYAGEVDIKGDGTECWRYIFVRPWIGLLGGAIMILIGYGAVTAVQAVVLWTAGREIDGIPPSPGNLVYLLVAGLVLGFLAVSGLAGVVVIERKLVAWLLNPTRKQRLAKRVSSLELDRTSFLHVVNAERRRIERDLHDGVQQRMVALGMLIGRARRGDDPRRRDELLSQAHDESQRLLSDLRDVTWRIYPAALEHKGLRVAVESIVDRCAIPVTLTFDVPRPRRQTIETAAYFVVSESMTNAVRHSRASHVEVSVVSGSSGLIVTVRDNGVGGAWIHGTGISGLRSRVHAVDGTFDVDSPEGGPTTIRAELP